MRGRDEDMDTRRGTALLSTQGVASCQLTEVDSGRTLGPRVVLAGVALVAPLLPAVPASAVAGTCEGRAATHLGTPGDDVLTGTDGDDVMVGLGGDDKISGLLGNDLICGDEGLTVWRGWRVTTASWAGSTAMPAATSSGRVRATTTSTPALTP